MKTGRENAIEDRKFNMERGRIARVYSSVCSTLSVAGMKALYWCMLVGSILLLVCEVTVSQLCKSFITLIDGFHSLFILMRMALTPHTSSASNPPLSSSDSLATPSSSPAAPPVDLPAESSARPRRHTQAAAAGSALSPDRPPPPPVNGSLSYTDYRIQVVGDFFSSLLLLSLCVSYVLEIISCSLEIRPILHPLTLAGVSVVSLLHKMLVLWLKWDREQAPGTEAPTGHLRGNITASGDEEAGGEARLERPQCDPGQAQSAVDGSFHNGALVFCNPKTSIIPETDSEPQEPTFAAPQQNRRDSASVAGVSDSSHSEDIMDISKDSVCVGHGDKSHDSGRSAPADPWRARLPMCVRATRGLCTALFALINSLAMLLIGPRCLPSPGACSFLVYLDPGLSLLAIIILIATAAPQLHRYGLLLLQATPPHICASELASRIASVPGVKGVHELHIWQLNESVAVASVHLRCHAGFGVHRCADVISGVTKVLQSAGVDCCTIQPEFVSCSGCSAGNDEASPIGHRESACLPRLLACSLACGKACTDSMCCTPIEGQSETLQEPEAGQEKAQAPQAPAFDNVFH
ncbi:proton-coupled zinc antiporter SLC30A1 [Brachionichthys hirsutus]|uniref:proton-coupled zinc antiporter SLC30A1 n=1 Tax=Brachionichthys hirsutus TaxID=412623 RepID=UPI0036048C42